MPKSGTDRTFANNTVSTLISKNVLVDGHRTSMRLEPAMWDALTQIATREKLTIHQICGIVNQHRVNTSLTSATRVFILGYFRILAVSLEQAAPQGQGRSIMNRVFQQTDEFRNTPDNNRYVGSL